MACILIDLKQPLLNFQHALIAAEHSSDELRIIENFGQPISELRGAVVEVLQEGQADDVQSVVSLLEELQEQILEVTTSGSAKLEKASLKSLTIEEPQTLADQILDPLIDIQSKISAVLLETEKIDSPVLQSSQLASSLVELRQYVSSAAHAATTLNDDEIINALTDLCEPLVDLQSALSLDHAPEEMLLIQNISPQISQLKQIFTTVLDSVPSAESESVRPTFQLLEDIQNQVPVALEKFQVEQRSQEGEKAVVTEVKPRVLAACGISTTLSNIHFALSSALEQHEATMNRENLPPSVIAVNFEDIRQNIAALAVAAGSTLEPMNDEDIIIELSALKEPLLHLQRVLLTEEHGAEEAAVLKYIVHPVQELRAVISNVLHTTRAAEVLPVLEILEEIEKDVPLVAKEVAKRSKLSKEKSKRAETVTLQSPRWLAGKISHPFTTIQDTLTAILEEKRKSNTKKSGVTASIEALKHTVTDIAITTSYSEPPHDEQIIEILAGLKEPLLKLQEAVTKYHEPEDLGILEDIKQPIKALHLVTLDALENSKEDSLQNVIEVLEEIENQVPLAMKEAIYKKELQQVVKSLEPESADIESCTLESEVREKTENPVTETKETEIKVIDVESQGLETASSDTASTIKLSHVSSDDGATICTAVSMKSGSQSLNQVDQEIFASDLLKSESVQIAEGKEELVKEKAIVSEELSKPKTAETPAQVEATNVKHAPVISLATIVSEPLLQVQLKLAHMLDNFDQLVDLNSHPSELSNSVEEIRQSVSTLHMLTAPYGNALTDEEIVSALQEFLQPLGNLQDVLGSKKHNNEELLILNHLDQPIKEIKDIVQRVVETKKSENQASFDEILKVLEQIEMWIPLMTKEINTRQQMLQILRDISRPLEIMHKCMVDLEATAKDAVETDVAASLGEPINALKETIIGITRDLDMLEQQQSTIWELKALVEPLIEFQSSLSVIKSSQCVVPETMLLAEKKNVIFHAVEGLKTSINATVEKIGNHKHANAIVKTLIALNHAMTTVQQQVNKTDYTRRPSVTLRGHMIGPLDHLSKAISALEDYIDQETYEVISQSLETLQKQILLAQDQFNQTDQPIDEEVIIEGFLYPTNQLQSALTMLRDNLEKKSILPITSASVELLQEFSESVMELRRSLTLLHNELRHETTGASIIETLSAIFMPLDNIKEIIAKIVSDPPRTEDILTVKDLPKREPSPVNQELRKAIQVALQTEESKQQETLKIEPQSEVKNATQVIQQAEMSTTENITDISNLIRELANPLQALQKTFIDIQEARTEISPKSVENWQALNQHLKDLQTSIAVIQEAATTPKGEDNSKPSVENQLLQSLFELNNAISTIQPETIEAEKISELKTEKNLKAIAVLIQPLEKLHESISISQEEAVPHTTEVTETKVTDLMVLAKPVEELKKSLVIFQEQSTSPQKIHLLEKSVLKQAVQLDLRPDEALSTEIPSTSDGPESVQQESKMETEQQLESDKKLAEPCKGNQTSNLSELQTIELESLDKGKPDCLVNLKLLTQFIIDLQTDIPDILTEKLSTADKLILAVTQNLERLQQIQNIIQSSDHTNILLPMVKPLDELNSASATIKAQNKEGITDSKRLTLLRKLILPIQDILNAVEAIKKEKTVVGLQSFEEKETRNLLSELTDSVKRLLKLIDNLTAKKVKIVEPEESESTTKDDINNIHQTTAQPLEELIEAIVVSQAQVTDSAADFQETSIIAELADRLEKLNTSIVHSGNVENITEPLEELKQAITSIQEQVIVTENAELSDGQQILLGIAQPLAEIQTSIAAIQNQTIGESEDASQLELLTKPLEELRTKIATSEERVLHEEHTGIMSEQLTPFEAVAKPLQDLIDTITVTQKASTLETATDKPAQPHNQFADRSVENEKKTITDITGEIVKPEEQTTSTAHNALQKLISPFEVLQKIISTSQEVHEENVTLPTERVTAQVIVQGLQAVENAIVTVQSQTDHDIQGTKIINHLLAPLDQLKQCITVIQQQAIEPVDHAPSLHCLKELALPLEELQKSMAIVQEQLAHERVEKLAEFLTLEALAHETEQLQKLISSIPEQNVSENILEKGMKELVEPVKELQKAVESAQILSQNIDQQVILEIKKPEELRAITQPLQNLQKTIVAVTESKEFANVDELAKPLSELETSLTLVREQAIAKEGLEIKILKVLVRPLDQLQTPILSVVKVGKEQSTSEEEERKNLVITELVEPIQELKQSITLIQDQSLEPRDIVLKTEERIFTQTEEPTSTVRVQERQQVAETIMENVPAETTQAPKAMETGFTVLEGISVSLQELQKSLAVIREPEVDKVTTSDLPKSEDVHFLKVLSKPVDELAKFVALIQQQTVLEVSSDVLSDEKSATISQTLSKSLKQLREFIAVVEKQPSEKQKAASSLVKAIVQPLTDLTASIASIQDELANKSRVEALPKIDNIPALKAMAQPLQELYNCLVSITQQAILEHGAEIISEELPLEMQAKVGEELTKDTALVEKITVLEPTAETVSPEDTSMLNTLAQPLEELQKSLSVIEECTIMEREMSFSSTAEEPTTLKVLIEPLAKLQNTILVVQEKAATEHTEQIHEDTLKLLALAEPLTELQKVIAVCQEEITVELQSTSVTAMKDVSAPTTIAQPLEELEKFIAIVQQQVAIASSSELTSEAESLSTPQVLIAPLEKIQKSIAAIRKHITFEPETTAVSLQDNAALLKALEKPLKEIQKSFAAIEEQMELNPEKISTSDKEHINLLKSLASPLHELQQSIVVIEEQVLVGSGDQLMSEKEDISILKRLAAPVIELQKSIATIQEQIVVDPGTVSILDKENIDFLKILAQPLEELEKCAAIVELQVTVESGTEAMPEASSSLTVPALAMPLREIQKSVAVIREHMVFESNVASTIDQDNIELLAALAQPLKEMQKSFADIEEQVVLEPGVVSISDKEDIDLLKTLASPIEELQRSIAVIQEQTLVESGNQSLSDKEDISILKTLAKPIIELQKSVATIQEQVLVEPGTVSISEKNDVSLLKTLAHPIDELQNSIAVVYEQIIAEPGTDSTSKAEGMPLLKTLVHPLEELQKSIAIIKEQNVIEPNEILISKSDIEAMDKLTEPIEYIQNSILNFKQDTAGNDDGNLTEFVELQSLLEPLQAIRDCVATIKQHSDACEVNEATAVMTTMIKSIEELDNSIENLIPESIGEKNELLQLLVEPLVKIKKTIGVVEDSLPKFSTIHELQTPLRALGESIQLIYAEIDQESQRVKEVEMDDEPLVADWSIINKLIDPVEGVMESILRIEEQVATENCLERAIEFESLKTLISPLEGIQKSFASIEEQASESKSIDQELAIESIVDSLYDLEKSISILQEQAVDKPVSQPAYGLAEAQMLHSLVLPLEELKKSITTVQDSSTTYLENLEQPLKELQSAMKVVELTLPLEINRLHPNLVRAEHGPLKSLIEPTEDIARTIELIQESATADKTIERTVEWEVLRTLIKPLRNVKEELISIQAQIIKEPDELETHPVADRILQPLKNLHQSICSIEEQASDKPIVDPVLMNSETLILKPLATSLNQLKTTIESLECSTDRSLSLKTLEDPLCQLRAAVNAVRDRALGESNDTKVQVGTTKLIAIPITELQACIAQIQEQYAETTEDTLSEISALETIARPIEELQREYAQIEQNIILESDSSLTLKREIPITEMANRVRDLQHGMMVMEQTLLENEQEDNNAWALLKAMQVPVEELEKGIQIIQHVVQEAHPTAESLEFSKNVVTDDEKKGDVEKTRTDDEIRIISEEEAEILRKEEKLTLDEKNKLDRAELLQKEELDRFKEAERKELEMLEAVDKRLEEEVDKKDRQLLEEIDDKETKDGHTSDTIKAVAEVHLKAKETGKEQKDDAEMSKAEEMQMKKVEETEQCKKDVDGKQQEEGRLKTEDSENKVAQDDRQETERAVEEKAAEEEKLIPEVDAKKLKQEEEELRVEVVGKNKAIEEEQLKEKKADKKQEKKGKEKEKQKSKAEEANAKKKADENEKTEGKQKEKEERLKAEEAEKKRMDEEQKLKKEEADRKQKEVDRLEVQEAEKKRIAEEERFKEEEEERLKKKEADKKQKEEEERLKTEAADKKQKEEEERLKKEEADKKQKEEEERLKKEEADKKQKEEEKRLKKEEADKIQKEEEEQLKKEEADKKQKAEEERLKKEAADKKQKEEEERLKKEQADQKQKEEEERLKKEAADKKQKEEEERLKKEAADKKQKEEEERLKKEEADKKQKEEEERLKKEEADKKQKEEEERLKKEAADKKQKEEEERLKKEAADKKKKEEEERLKKEEADKKQKEEEERLKKDQADKIQKEEEERLKTEAADKKQKEEEERLKKDQADKIQKEEEERLKTEAADKKQKEEEERLKKEAADKKQKEEEERLKKEAADKKKKEEEERLKKEEADKKQKEEEERLKKDQADKIQKEEEERLKTEAADKKQKEEEERLKKEAADKKQKEEEERLKKDQADKIQKEEEDRLKKEEADKIQKEEEERLKKDQADKIQKEEEERFKTEAADKKQKEEEERLKKEAADKKKKEEEKRLKKEEADKKQKEEEERLKKEEAHKIQKEEEERLKKEEADKKQKAEEERLKKEAADKKKKKEEDRLKKEEADKKQREEEERLKKEAADKKQKEEEERLKKEQADKKQKEEEERLKKEAADKKQKEEEERLKKEAAEKKRIAEEKQKDEDDQLKAKEAENKRITEEERMKKDEADRKQKEEERLKKEEADRKQKEQEERLKKEAANKKQKKEEKRLKKEEADKKQKEEEERLKKEEADKKQKAEEERLKKEEAYKKQKEEEEQLKKEAADKKQKEEEERLKKEEADKKQKAEEERLKKEAADKKKKEEEERLKKEEAVKKQKEEEERLKKEAADKKQKDEEERLKKEEADKKQKEEEERLKAAEAEKERNAEEERLKKEEADRKRKDEGERLKAEEAESNKKAKEERVKKEEADNKQSEEAKKLEEEGVAKKKVAEEERAKKKKVTKKRKGEAERLSNEAKEEEQLSKEGAEKKQVDKAEQVKRASEETERTKKEELERKHIEEKQHLDKEEAGIKRTEESQKLQREQEKKYREESELMKEEEVEKEKTIGDVEKLKKEAEKVETDEAERIAKEKAEQQRDVAEHQEKEKLKEAEQITKELEVKEKIEEADKLSAEAVEKQEQEAKQKKLEEEDRLKKEKVTRNQNEEVERKQKNEASEKKREEESERLQNEEVKMKENNTEQQLKKDKAEVKDKEMEENLKKAVTKKKQGERQKKPKKDKKKSEDEKSEEVDETKRGKQEDTHLIENKLQKADNAELKEEAKYETDTENSLSMVSEATDSLREELIPRSHRRRSKEQAAIEVERSERASGRSRSYDTQTPTILEDSESQSLRSSNGRTRAKSYLTDDGGESAAYYSATSKASAGNQECGPRDLRNKPMFCTKLTDRTAAEGSRIKLTCTVLGSPEPQIWWSKDDQKLGPSNRYRTSFENGMASLEFYAALPEDSGEYSCTARNTHGQSTTEARLKVYAGFEPSPLPPTFTRSMKDTYRFTDNELVLECRVRGQPAPVISWMKDGKPLCGGRYQQSDLSDGVCRLQISNPDSLDSGQYTCKAENQVWCDQISHMVHFEGRETYAASKRDRVSQRKISRDVRRPHFANILTDHSVPAGGTIALQVEVKGMPAPEVTWLHGDTKRPVQHPKARTFAESGVYTLMVPEATDSETGTYICRASNAYGYVDTSASVQVVAPSSIKGGKPAMFVSRPDNLMTVAIGEDVSISFRVTGTPKPKVTWMKGIRDITNSPRSHKESIDDYVRLTQKRTLASDEGTYCVLAKNCYGCDRTFVTVRVKQRARSLTPSPEWGNVDTSNLLADIHDGQRTYVKHVPGPISSEPIVVDSGRNWLALSWGKAEQRGPAPVIAYRVDAWLLGGDGGARWAELGVTPINTFDAFNLRPGSEYKFRVTPRNRYGWGESVITSTSCVVGEVLELPEFTSILPGQLKALEDSTVSLECEVRADSKVQVRWYRDSTEIDSSEEPRYKIYYNGTKCCLNIANITAADSGRYVCEATNKVGRVSTFARVLVVADPKILEADAKLKSLLDGSPDERPPQFTMRLRDRRVQMTYPVRLTCQVIGHQTPEVVWYKNGREIRQDASHILWNDESHFHTLEITHSTLEDSGCYMATARNSTGSVSCRCILVVDKGIRAYVAPEFLYGLDATYTTQVGGELRMSAQVEAYPSVGVVWHRDGIRLRPSRRAVMTLNHDGTVELSLANATPRDAGVYSCTATNEVGRTETSAKVIVIGNFEEAKPLENLPVVVAPDIPYSKEPLFVTKPLSTEAVEGDTVIILCEVVGDPKPDVMWLRDFLRPDYYRDAPHFRRVGEGPQYRLEIPYAKIDFTGTYTVIAKNCHGEAKAIISLQIYAKGQGKEDRMDQTSVKHGKVVTLPLITRELRDLRCCDGDAVTLECKVYATPVPDIRWEKDGRLLPLGGDFTTEFDGETAQLSIQHVYPEDEGEYTCVAYNDLGKAFTSACLVVDVPEEKENALSQHLRRPVGLLSAGSTPRSTPRSTPIRSLSPSVARGREFRTPSQAPQTKRLKVTAPKFYAVPHNRVAEEGETVRFQCAVSGHPTPWVTWDKNGVVVTPSTRISVKERDDVRVLEISEVTVEDAGLYRVTLENDVGRVEATARLEIIGRHGSVSRGIRARSASPRTYPTFGRSLLGSVARINGRLQLQCDIRGSPSPAPSWYRNGKPLERSDRIKRFFDGRTTRVEITKVKATDAGQYTCQATNVMGTTRNSCLVTVLDADDPSTADRDPPKFVDELPEESIVMEGHSYELQVRLSGTPPFVISWLKDSREVPDSDYYRYVVYGDGGVALRLSDVYPQDAGEYTCLVRNDFGKAKTNGLFAVQDYKGVPKMALQFTKTPVSVLTSKGATVQFCARVQSGRPAEFKWTVNGRDAKVLTKCKMEKDGSTSILRITGVSLREVGEVRCTAGVAGGRGPTVSATARLDFDLNSVPRLESPANEEADYADGAAAFIRRDVIRRSTRSSPGSPLVKKKREAPKPPGTGKENKPATPTVTWPTPRTPFFKRRVIPEAAGRKKAPYGEEGKACSSLRRTQSLEKSSTVGSRLTKTRSSLREVKKLKEKAPLSPLTSNSVKKVEVAERILSPERMVGVPVIDVPSMAVPEMKEQGEVFRSAKQEAEVVVKDDTESVTKDEGQDDGTIEKILSSASDNVQMVLRKFKSELGSRENLRRSNCDKMLVEETCGSLITARTSSVGDQLVVDDSPAIKCLRILERSQSPPEDIKKRLAEVRRPSLERFEPALILKAPSDITALRGARVVLRATYKGHPEPRVKWLRAGRELIPDEKVGITSGGGVSCLTLDSITADHAGKYIVSLENALGRDFKHASVAVEGPPDPPAGSPAVYPGIGTATVTWRSPPYDGGCMVTGYCVEMRRSHETSWTVVAEACHSLSHTVSDLTPEDVYLFRVRAENIHGASEPGPESRPVTIDEDEEQFKPAFEAREVSFEDGQLFKDRYEVLEELGKGRYGIVRKVLERASGQYLAAKFIRAIKAKDKEQVRDEVMIMNLLRHPKLLQLAAAFESPREVVMVTEYITGGELFERVVADDFTLTERDSILFMRQICEGVAYMHDNNVVHLDLKPENIMCHTRTSHQIKLIDFGLAQMLKPDTPVRVLFGTPEFIPPEIINYEPIGTETDMWSVGVICYVLLTGLSPFMGDNDAETFANITRADYDFDDEAFDAISQDAKDFISALLEKRKELRMSAKQCLEHPWMAQHSESMSVVALPTDKLKKFIIRRKWQPSTRVRTRG
nr:titin homolog isoform X3 [Neodiprion pinetum]